MKSRVAATTGSYQNNLAKIFEPLIRQNIDTYDENNLQTWVHHVIYDISTKNNANNKDNKENHKINLTESDINLIRGDVIGMLSAGIDTTGFTLEYAVLLLAKYPKCQELVYNELIKKFENKEFSLARINECPLFRAFVSEVLRCSSSAAQGGPRTSFVDYEIELTKDNLTEEYSSFIGKKFIIPKDSHFQVNILYFNKAEIDEFNINNWLKNDEVNNTCKYESNHPNVIPFSIGKRSCPGENVALAEINVSLAAFILNYKLSSTVKPETMEIKTYVEASRMIHPKIGVKVDRR
jgi:cytochrome P450